MPDGEIAKFEIEQLLKERLPGMKFPQPLVNLMKSILHEKDINSLFINAPGKKNLEFIDSCMSQLDFKCNVIGDNNIPTDGRRLIFVSNHPQGGVEAICIAYILGHKYSGRIKFYANEILTVLTPLKEMFLPIYKRQLNKESYRLIHEFCNTDDHLILFPAGVTSYKTKGRLGDREWHKNFIKTAIRHQRDIVPLYFEARNSDLFYCIESFRKLIRSKFNFDVLLFAHEFFRQRGKNFTLYAGMPISWQTFDKSKSLQEWALWVQDISFSLPGRK